MIDGKSIPLQNRRIRATAHLQHNLERSVQSYVAGARGVVGKWNKGTLAVSALGLATVVVLEAPFSMAEIVYSPASIQIHVARPGITTYVPLDVDHDGQPDFTFLARWGTDFSSTGFSSTRLLAVLGNKPSNQAVSSEFGFKAALAPGAVIGNGAKFGPNVSMDTCSLQGSFGPWVNVKGRYLGIKFQINGETHYGWIRMNVQCDDGTITGYAYETVPNRPLDAGILPFANDSSLSPVTPLPSSPVPATLGVLATGAAGLSIWRGE
jgi:hypothetical protein